MQVELKEYVKIQDSIYEVDPREEDCFRFSRLLNFKVKTEGPRAVGEGRLSSSLLSLNVSSVLQRDAED